MSFLGTVIQQKEREIVHKTASLPLDVLEKRIGTEDVRDFHEALSGGGRIIAEVKKKSPVVSGFPCAADVAALASVYKRNGAAAVSIVTDEENFGTSLGDVGKVRAAASLAVLVKDFVIDPYQIYEARDAGADAVLLISRIVAADMLGRLLETTRALGMTALVEVHEPDDVGKALEAGATVLGINNRDLDTLEVNLDTTRELIRSLPDDVTVVSESGITTRREIVEFAALGVDAFLIGGALLESADPGALLHELCGRAAINNDTDTKEVRRNA